MTALTSLKRDARYAWALIVVTLTTIITCQPLLAFAGSTADEDGMPSPHNFLFDHDKAEQVAPFFAVALFFLIVFLLAFMLRYMMKGSQSKQGLFWQALENVPEQINPASFKSLEITPGATLGLACAAMLIASAFWATCITCLDSAICGRVYGDIAIVIGLASGIFAVVGGAAVMVWYANLSNRGAGQIKQAYETWQETGVVPEHQEASPFAKPIDVLRIVVIVAGALCAVCLLAVAALAMI